MPQNLVRTLSKLSRRSEILCLIRNEGGIFELYQEKVNFVSFRLMIDPLLSSVEKIRLSRESSFPWKACMLIDVFI